MQRTTAVRRWSGWAAVLAVLLLGCGSEATEPGPVPPPVEPPVGPPPPVPPTTALVLVTIRAEGLGPQPAAYDIEVDGALRAGIKPGTIYGLQVEPGRRTLSFRSPPAHCAVGESARVVEVSSERPTEVTFVATCVGGAIRLLAELSGDDVPFAVRLSVSGALGGAAWSSATLFPLTRGTVVAGLPGDVELRFGVMDLPSNCRGTEPPPTRVVVNDTVEVTMSVACELLQPSGGILFGLANDSMVRRLDDGRLITVGAGRDPAWAPDGKSFAFVNVRDDGYFGRERAGVAVAASAGAAVRVLATGRHATPSYTSDGREIYWVEEPSLSCPWGCSLSLGQRVFRAAVAAGPSPTTLLWGPPEIGSAVLLPDAATLLTSNGGVLKLRSLADGSTLTLFEGREAPPGANHGDIQSPQPLRLSPDGRDILFTTSCRDGYGQYVIVCGTYVVPLDGSAPRLISTSARGMDWSPDGTRILMRQGQRIFTVRASDGGDEQPLARFNSDVLSASWSR